MTRTLPRRQFLHLAAGAAALPMLSRPALAQAYPSRPINMVVPFAAGGPSDAVARVLAEGMRGPLGQTLTIENVAGAGGTLGTTRTARATPDGYTIMVGLWGTHVVNPVIYTSPYDVPTSFEPAGLISTTPHLIAAKQALPANDLKGLIAWLKANPGKATVGHAGAGSPPHVGAVFFQNRPPARPFSSCPIAALVPPCRTCSRPDRHVDRFPVTVVPQLKAGKIKAFAIAEKSRPPPRQRFPDRRRSGPAGLHFSNWFGLYAPKGTPQRS
jgi:tripartite-type tricarboxylate transporter receptor subunit TctC